MLDAVAELTNMIIGSVKNQSPGAGIGAARIEHPDGRFRQEFPDEERRPCGWKVRRFHWDSDVFEVRICLAPSERPIGLQPTLFGRANHVGI